MDCPSSALIKHQQIERIHQSITSWLADVVGIACPRRSRILLLQRPPADLVEFRLLPCCSMPCMQVPHRAASASPCEPHLWCVRLGCWASASLLLLSDRIRNLPVLGRGHCFLLGYSNNSLDSPVLAVAGQLSYVRGRAAQESLTISWPHFWRRRHTYRLPLSQYAPWLPVFRAQAQRGDPCNAKALVIAT